jgi:PAS domain S-box-containing protein
VALYSAVVESSDDAILTKDLDGTITGWNPAAERLYGYSAEEAIGRNVELIVPEDRREELRKILRGVAAGERTRHFETVRRTRDGRRIDVSLTISPVVDSAGRAVGASTIARDVTERRRAEALLAERTEELRQAQKMEAIGRLGSGVAHDFNNLLTVVIGAAQLLRMRVEGDEDRELTDEILDAAQQAAGLTAQLLAFGRRAPAGSSVFDLNRLIDEVRSMLARLIGSDVRLTLALGAENANVEADPVQLQQVIVNLVVNARDAMPTGGGLEIATANVQLDEPPPGASELEPGPFVRIEVADEGVGMEPGQLERIFEPFFTTKGPGKGTGLGLSTSYGIVSQLGGHLAVRSAPGEGTTFSILLPRAEASAAAAAPAGREAGESGGTETILLVDDQEALRRVAARVLRGAGYEVLEAGGGAEAIEAAEGHGGGIDLLLTDLVMPETNGYELAEALRKARPETRTLFMSGHPPATRERYGEAARQEHLAKPFTPDDLRGAVRRALDGDRPDG